ncbi:MAG: DUF4321 domain-containing protein [Clostridia bacterium]|nr:DUF4321 domain-containing protein [Clostridia bacterium]
MRKGFWLNLFFVCVGVVVGTLAADLLSDIPLFSFLSYGMDFGMPSPATFDLKVLTVTFGVSLNLNISVILFIVLAVVLGNLVRKK